MSATTIRREIHPEVRIIDRDRGTVDYVASDESVDSYREVIRASGWRFTNFKKNAPFVDSHDYSTIQKMVGRVVDFRVDTRKGQLIERVQWAIDVPDNDLARLGWKMTESGYLKAVSVGFIPIKYLTEQSSKRSEWLKQLVELGLDESNAPRTIYVEQEQIELSACVIGANPNALLAAHKAGALSDRDVELFQRRAGSPAIFQIPFAENHNHENTMKLARIAARFDRTSTSAFAPHAKAQRGDSDAELLRVESAARHFYRATEQLNYAAFRDTWLTDSPRLRLHLNTIARAYTNTPMNDEQKAHFRALGVDSGFGAELMLETSAAIFDLLPIHGAWATLGFQSLQSKKGRFGVITAYPEAQFFPESGLPIPEDAIFDGTAATADTLLLGVLMSVPLRLLEDSESDISALVLDMCTQSLNQRLDYGCFAGDGTVDGDNGGITGIFVDGLIPANDAAAGHVTLQLCDREDFIGTIEAVDPAALQYPCRWWVSTALLPALLRCVDAAGRPLLKRPPGAKEFQLIDYPVTLVPSAPSTNAAGNKVMAFGAGDSYAVALRNFFKFEASDHHKWNELKRTFRAVGSAQGKLRKADGLAILKTAAA